jgi:hypothetical protein
VISVDNIDHHICVKLTPERTAAENVPRQQVATEENAGGVRRHKS